MKTTDNLLELITGHAALHDMIDLMRANSKEFRDDEQRYRTALEELRRKLPADLSPSLDDYLNAFDADMVATIQSAAYLGFQVNLANFHSPVGVNFVRMDTIDYLKGHIVGRFPANHNAAKIMDDFSRALPDSYDDLWDDMRHYFVDLECACPKLAHYHGYLLANRILPMVEPGYVADECQTSSFSMVMHQYLGFWPDTIEFCLPEEQQHLSVEPVS